MQRSDTSISQQTLKQVVHRVGAASIEGAFKVPCCSILKAASRSENSFRTENMTTPYLFMHYSDKAAAAAALASAMQGETKRRHFIPYKFRAKNAIYSLLRHPSTLPITSHISNTSERESFTQVNIPIMVAWDRPYEFQLNQHAKKNNNIQLGRLKQMNPNPLQSPL